jgi:hypothetical protein
MQDGVLNIPVVEKKVIETVYIGHSLKAHERLGAIVCSHPIIHQSCLSPKNMEDYTLPPVLSTSHTSTKS